MILWKHQISNRLMSKQTYQSTSTPVLKPPPFTTNTRKTGYGRSSVQKTLEKVANEGEHKIKMEDMRNTMNPSMRACTLISNPFFKGYPDHGTSNNVASIDGKVYANRKPKCTCGRSVFNDKFV